MNLIWSLLPVTNMMLSAFNYKHDYGWQKRRNYFSNNCPKEGIVKCLIEDGTLSDLSIIGLQVIVVVLQATLAMNFHRLDKLAKEDRFTQNNLQLNKPAPDQSQVGAYLQNVFNSKNKLYLTIVGKTLKGILEFSDAFGTLSTVP